jgi:hypothetical protein
LERLNGRKFEVEFKKKNFGQRNWKNFEAENKIKNFISFVIEDLEK